MFRVRRILKPSCTRILRPEFHTQATRYSSGDEEEVRQRLAAQDVGILSRFDSSEKSKYFLRVVDGRMHVGAENDACMSSTMIELDATAGWQIVGVEGACD